MEKQNFSTQSHIDGWSFHITVRLPTREHETPPGTPRTVHWHCRQQGQADKQTVTLILVLTHVPKSFIAKVIPSCLCSCRTWRTDLPKGMCMLVAISVEHEEAPLMGAVRAIVMDSQYLIEPCGSGKARLTHICRTDLK